MSQDLTSFRGKRSLGLVNGHSMWVAQSGDMGDFRGGERDFDLGATMGNSKDQYLATSPVV